MRYVYRHQEKIRILVTNINSKFASIAVWQACFDLFPRKVYFLSILLFCQIKLPLMDPPVPQTQPAGQQKDPTE